MQNKDCQKLRSCPFCGGEAEIFENDDRPNEWYAACVNPECKCEAYLPFAKTVTEAAAAWNRRTEGGQS